MKKIICFLFLAIPIISYSQTIPYNGKSYFINGANVPWHYFGSDVGTHYQWGALYDAQWFENMFVDCETYGINCVRLWIHCDGRSSPEFGSNGFVTGLDNNFFADLDDIFLRAKNHNIMVMPCLWSFDMTKNSTSGAGIYAGLHADLITDTLKTNSYINTVLIPMVQRYANTCNLFAWEIINEPEWSMNISGGGNTVQTVSTSQMQRFVGMQAKAIHQHSNKMVTVGAASLKWNSDIYSISTPCVGNFWKNSQIQNAYNHSLAYLDFYQIHYYSWMHAPWIFDPVNLSYPFNYWLLDKPTIIGEIGAIDPDYSNSTILSNTYANNFAGVMFWSVAANDGHGTFNDFKNQSLNFRNSHSGIIDFSCNVSTIENKYSNKKHLLYPTIANDYIVLDCLETNTAIIIYDLTGREIMVEKAAEKTARMNVSSFKKGMYYVRLVSGNKCISDMFIKQ